MYFHVLGGPILFVYKFEEDWVEVEACLCVLVCMYFVSVLKVLFVVCLLHCFFVRLDCLFVCLFVWLGDLVWFGLVWFGLVWFGLVWFSLV